MKCTVIKFSFLFFLALGAGPLARAQFVQDESPLCAEAAEISGVVWLIKDTAEMIEPLKKDISCGDRLIVESGAVRIKMKTGGLTDEITLVAPSYYKLITPTHGQLLRGQALLKSTSLQIETANALIIPKKSKDLHAAWIIAPERDAITQVNVLENEFSFANRFSPAHAVKVGAGTSSQLNSLRETAFPERAREIEMKSLKEQWTAYKINYDLKRVHAPATKKMKLFAGARKKKLPSMVAETPAPAKKMNVPDADVAPRPPQKIARKIASLAPAVLRNHDLNSGQKEKQKLLQALRSIHE